MPSDQDPVSKIANGVTGVSHHDAAAPRATGLAHGPKPGRLKATSVGLTILGVGLSGVAAIVIAQAAVPQSQGTDRLAAETQPAVTDLTPPARKQQVAAAEGFRLRLFSAVAAALPHGQVSDGVRATNWSTTETPTGVSQNLSASVVWKNDRGDAVTFTAVVTSKTWSADANACLGALRECRKSLRSDGSQVRFATPAGDRLARTSSVIRRDGSTAEVFQLAGASELPVEAPAPGELPRPKKLEGPSKLPMTDEQLVELAAGLR